MELIKHSPKNQHLQSCLTHEVRAGLHRATVHRGDAVVEPVVLFDDDLAAEAVAANLLELGERVDVVVVVTADHPLVSQAIDELRGNGVPVVAYVTDLSAASRAGFVGTDNLKAGRTAAWIIGQMSGESGTIEPFIGSYRYQCQDISNASFRSYMRENAPGLLVTRHAADAGGT